MMKVTETKATPCQPKAKAKGRVGEGQAAQLEVKDQEYVSTSRKGLALRAETANTPTSTSPRQLQQNKARGKTREANLPKAKVKGRAKGNQVAHREESVFTSRKGLVTKAMIANILTRLKLPQLQPKDRQRQKRKQKPKPNREQEQRPPLPCLQL